MFRSMVATLMLTAAACTHVLAAEYEVGQKNKTFTTSKLTVKVGDVVYFSNQDPFFHNVYSISDIQPFDLGSYPKGQRKAVTFDKAGVVHVECAIHPTMHMEVHVEQ